MSGRRVRILYVAYPMLPVTETVPGGAEQMLWTLEREMHRRGHDTTVAACEGSEVAGRLISTGSPPQEVDAYEERECEHEERVIAEVRRAADAGEPYDVVHDKGGAFWRRADEIATPVLATLHLPRHFYPANAFESAPRNVSFNCVSESQRRTFEGVPRVLGAVQNGIFLPELPTSAKSTLAEGYLLWIGRICEEKGTHVAIEVARRAGLPLVMAGEVYRFSYHQAYFEREVKPHLGENVSFVEQLSREAKWRLMAGARAVLVTSLVEETSSLVSMEAMACGTPVLAFGRGALPEVVRDGITGFVVSSTEEMVEAAGRTAQIDGRVCREHVVKNFSSGRMADDYERLYELVPSIEGRVMTAEC